MTYDSNRCLKKKPAASLMFGVRGGGGAQRLLGAFYSISSAFRQDAHNGLEWGQEERREGDKKGGGGEAAWFVAKDGGCIYVYNRALWQ